MKRWLKTVAVALVVMSYVPIASSSSASATVADQRREVERVVDQLDALGTQADALAEDYNNALAEQESLKAEIATAEQRVADKAAEIDVLQSELVDVAVQSYVGTDDGALGPLLSDADSYSDQLRGDQLRSVALDMGSVSTDDLDAALSELADEQAALEAARDRQAELIEKINDDKATVEQSIADYKQLRSEAEAKLGQLIAEEEQRRAAAALAQAQAAAAAERPASNAGGGSSSGGGVASPAAAAPSGGGGSAPSPSGQSGTAVANARTQLGLPYRFGSESPGVAFDCSGLTKWAWGTAGVSLPHKASGQAAMLPGVSAANVQPGDLIFFNSPATHVGMYVGGGQMIHAPATGDVVKISSVSWGRVSKIGRPG